MAKRLIIAGGAYCLWQDYHKLPSEFKKAADVMVINATGLYWPHNFQHWVSLHRENFKSYRKFCFKSYVTHSNRVATCVDRVWNIESWGADSSLFACKVALRLGYDRIILIGVPLDGGPRFYDPEGAKCYFDTTNLHDIWKTDSSEFENKVRSISGYTKDLLGPITEEWINGLENSNLQPRADVALARNN